MRRPLIVPSPFGITFLDMFSSSSGGKGDPPIEYQPGEDRSRNKDLISRQLKIKGEMGLVSGAPRGLSTAGECGRTVYITKYMRGATQSGLLHSLRGHWRIEFDRGGVHRKWENPLMGWTSSNDPVEGVALSDFETVEDAVVFANSQGWRALVASPTGEGHFRADNLEAFEESLKNSGDTLLPPGITEDAMPKTYADNFKYSPDSLRIYRTK